jgi:TatD DNase family protein
VYACVGLHPIHTSASFHDEDELGDEGKTFTSKGEAFSSEAYRALAQDEKTVAIGECGLDYFRTTGEEEKKKQVDAFMQQIALANEVGKPLMLHIRSGAGGDAYRDALEILRAHARVRGNAHFFAGSLADAQDFWDMGFSTSFTGVVTFTRDYDELVRSAPEHLIHAETDAPYVAPTPYRGQRNEPLYVREVVARLAEIRGAEPASFAERLCQNAKELYGISCV